MVSLYTAHISDLGPDYFVHVECGCGHEELLSAAMLATGRRRALCEGVRPAEAAQMRRVPVERPCRRVGQVGE
jgi:hypothetical protein